MTITEFRRLVRTRFPHVKASVRTVGFTDLARASAKCLAVEGDRGYEELRQINAWAKEAGIVPDGNIR